MPDVSLTPEIGDPVRLDDESYDNDRGGLTSAGEWVRPFGFRIVYRGLDLGAFEQASAASERDRVLSVALQLMSEVQDIVAEATTEPWPALTVDGRRDMAMAGAAVEGDHLHMWYGERSDPALHLPSVDLV